MAGAAIPVSTVEESFELRQEPRRPDCLEGLEVLSEAGYAGFRSISGIWGRSLERALKACFKQFDEGGIEAWHVHRSQPDPFVPSWPKPGKRRMEA
jgi:hypothetical protein